MPRVLTWRQVAAAAVVATIPLLSGCGALAVVQAVDLISALASNEPHWVETNRQEFAYPVGDVYAQLVHGVERSGVQLVEQDPATHTLLVSYPFSLLKNNWGGSMRITCAATEFGTNVTIQGDGRDVVSRVRKFGDDVLEDLGSALRRQARTL
jgi:hypothetical protein